MIKIGFCVSYDWEMLKVSLPRIYNEADIICLGLDKDRHAWSCAPYEFDNEKFYAFIKEIDKERKIDIYEDDFSLPELNSRENCNRHRMKIAERMGPDGWHIQIDADEYFLDFKAFVSKLRNICAAPTFRLKPFNVCCPFIPLIKRVGSGYLYVDFLKKMPEIIPVATTRPDYQRARQNGHFNVVTDSYVIHETWARSDEELLFKINNWGHSSEELEQKYRRNSYYKLWQSLDEYNCNYVHNFHPAKADVWPALRYEKGADIYEFIHNFQVPDFPFNKFQLFLKNSRNISRIRSMFKF